MLFADADSCNKRGLFFILERSTAYAEKKAGGVKSSR